MPRPACVGGTAGANALARLKPGLDGGDDMAEPGGPEGLSSGEQGTLVTIFAPSPAAIFSIFLAM